MASRKRQGTYAEQRVMILGPFLDFLAGKQPDIDGLLAYMQHCRINLAGIDTNDPNGVTEAILNHYRTGTRSFDINRAAKDLMTEPSIQRRMAELKAKHKAGLEAARRL